MWEYLKLVRTSHLKQCQVSQSTTTFSTWSRACLQVYTASVHLILKGPAAQLRYMSTNQKYELKKSICICKIQFDSRCSLARKHPDDFMISDWFDRFDSTSSPLWDCDLGSSRMAADHYEGINLSAALQAQHLAARCDSKSAEPGDSETMYFCWDLINSRLSYRQNKLLILNM